MKISDIHTIEKLKYIWDSVGEEAEIELEVLFQNRNKSPGVWPDESVPSSRGIINLYGVSDLVISTGIPIRTVGLDMADHSKSGFESYKYEIYDYESGSVRIKFVDYKLALS
ncbi:MAG: hypothetical protein AAGN64_06620 [Bacteroidota bacterium]